MKEGDYFSKGFCYFGVNSNRIMALSEPICFLLPIWMTMIYVSISAASNVLIVEIRVSFSSDCMMRG
jgi:hypothetical protein